MENNEFGAYHLADNPELYDVQRDNNFQFIVTGIDDLVNLSTGERIGNAQKVLQFAVKSASVPTFTQDVINIKRGNSTIKLAGTPSFNEAKITITDFIGADSKSAILSWQHLSYNAKADKVGRASNYKKTCYLIEYTPDWKKVRTWKLFGCFIKGVSQSEYNQEQGGEKTIDAEIVYDRAIMELPEEE